MPLSGVQAPKSIFRILCHWQKLTEPIFHAIAGGTGMPEHFFKLLSRAKASRDKIAQCRWQLLETLTVFIRKDSNKSRSSFVIWSYSKWTSSKNQYSNGYEYNNYHRNCHHQNKAKAIYNSKSN